MQQKNLKTAKAHANIAIIKYWGKRDEHEVLPYNSSISFTLEAFYTKTLVVRDETLEKDVFVLNGEEQAEEQCQKASLVLDFFRPSNQKPYCAKIFSFNSMPTAAGLSSSSSGLAALVLAANESFPCHPPRSLESLASLARKSSGSACRSFFSPFALWDASWAPEQKQKERSFVRKVDCPLQLSMFILVLSDKKKDFSSRFGMKHTVETSSLFSSWVEQANQDAEEMLVFMKQGDFASMGALMEKNTLLMHETTRHAVPPFSYLTDETWQVLERIQALRAKGVLPAYFTMDAGPNVKLLCESKDKDLLFQTLQTHFSHLRIIYSEASPQAFEVLEGDQVSEASSYAA